MNKIVKYNIIQKFIKKKKSLLNLVKLKSNMKNSFKFHSNKNIVKLTGLKNKQNVCGKTFINKTAFKYFN